MEEFTSLIVKGKIKQPTERKFSLQKWHEEWQKCPVQSERGMNIYEAGIIFDQLFKQIRASISSLYQTRSPGKIKKEKLLQCYLAMSNRSHFNLYRTGMERISETRNVYGTHLNNTLNGENITIEEAAHVLVDGFRPAINACIYNQDEILPAGTKPADIMLFTKYESVFSQLYEIYENYWQALVWGDYSLITEKDDNQTEYFHLKENDSEKNIKAKSSLLRKQKLITQKNYKTHRNTEGYYFDIKREGKKKVVKVYKDNNAPLKIKAFCASFQHDVKKITSLYPEEFRTEPSPTHGIILADIINVFRNLVILSQLFFERLPQNDVCENFAQLKGYLITFDRKNIIEGMRKTLNISHEKIIKIVGFLTYSTDKNKDFWCNPLIRTAGDKFYLMSGAIFAPVMQRVIEHWMVSLGYDVATKGKLYEEHLVKLLNNSVIKNDLIKDFLCVNPGEVKIKGTVEEIDLIIFFGTTIIIADAKAKVSTDSPVSLYRTWQTMEGASHQTRRKAKFIADNLESFLTLMDRKYSPEQQYHIHPCIINSNKVYVGCECNEVPICDESILYAFFKENQFPVVSHVNSDGRPEHLVNFIIYNNQHEAEKIIDTYLKQPPQLLYRRKDYRYVSSKLPYIEGTDIRMKFSRLVPSNFTVDEMLSRKYPYPLYYASDKEIKYDILL